jgi:hypothetical protein
LGLGCDSDARQPHTGGDCGSCCDDAYRFLHAVMVTQTANVENVWELTFFDPLLSVFRGFSRCGAMPNCDNRGSLRPSPASTIISIQ